MQSARARKCECNKIGMGSCDYNCQWHWRWPQIYCVRPAVVCRGEVAMYMARAWNTLSCGFAHRRIYSVHRTVSCHFCDLKFYNREFHRKCFNSISVEFSMVCLDWNDWSSRGGSYILKYSDINIKMINLAQNKSSHRISDNAFCLSAFNPKYRRYYGSCTTQLAYDFIIIFHILIFH